MEAHCIIRILILFFPLPYDTFCYREDLILTKSNPWFLMVYNNDDVWVMGLWMIFFFIKVFFSNLYRALFKWKKNGHIFIFLKISKIPTGLFMEPGKLILEIKWIYLTISLNGPWETRRAKPAMKNKELKTHLRSILVVKLCWHRDIKIGWRSTESPEINPYTKRTMMVNYSVNGVGTIITHLLEDQILFLTPYTHTHTHTNYSVLKVEWRPKCDRTFRYLIRKCKTLW